MIFSSYRTSAATIALGVLGTSAAFGASPVAVDLGGLDPQASAQTISVTVALKLNDPNGAEAMIRRLATPGDPLYQKFLTPDQVEARFGPTGATVDSVTANLRLHGLTVTRTSSTTLSVTGTPAALEKTFQTSLHQFQMPATATTPGYSYRAATSRPTPPAEIAPSVQAVLGLSTAPAFHTNYRLAPESLLATKSANPSAGGNPLGFLTVKDFAALYNVDPLYAKGVTGNGHTLAIVTLAGFTPSDVFGYWSSLGLKVNSNRLSVVDIDGGPGAPSDASGSAETTLDVEQSGGIAPGAKIIVYQAPNTNQGFLDAFAAAIQSNKPDSISTSWGEWEFFNNLANSPVTDPFSGETVSALQATHELLLEAALQGQSFFAAAGDCGAYDVFDEVPANDTTPLTVDYPGSDTAITSAGGTTLPGTQSFGLPSGKTLNITVSTERVWGWDYLEPLCKALNQDPITCGIYPVGGGGGVSVFFSEPFYQFLTAGVQASQSGQVFADESTTPPTTIFALPGHFRGRNVPDVSFNADPDTGYIIPYTSDKTGFSVLNGGGGTSFVAPQLNGVTALLNQNAGHRLGLLNPLLYGAQLIGSFSRSSVLNTISTGDNWFYTARNGYAPAAGLGTLNVSAFAALTK